MKRGSCLSLVLLYVLAASAAHASAHYKAAVPPAPDQAYESYPTEQPPPPEEKGIDKMFQWGIGVGVPVFLNVDSSIVRPGADLDFFGGLDIGYVMFALGVGIMWTPVSASNIPGAEAGLGRSPLTRLYFFPEVRFQVPNESLALPYLSGTFDANWWNFRETGVNCGWWYCTQTSVYRFTPGFTGKVGVALEIKRGIHIDMGMKYSLSGKGDFFARTEWWLTPFVGVIVRR